MFHSTPKKRVLFVRRLTPALLVVFGVLSLLLVNVRSPKMAYATASSTVNFQARLQTAGGAVVPDGYYNVEFKLYSASSGGSALWTEDYTHTSGPGSTDVRLQVKDGYLSTALGGINAFPGTLDWSQQMYLTMNIGGTGTSASWDGEMSPRLALTATPYSFLAQRAAEADTLSTTNSNGTNTLSIQGPGSGAGGQNFVLQDQGVSGTYYLLAANGSGNVSVSGLATAANIATGSIDRASAGTLTIGSSTATALSIGNTSTNIATTINGTAIVKPTSGHDTTGVFQVQTATGTALLDVDTSTSTVKLGATGSTALASTVDIATSTAAAQTVTVGSGYGSSVTTVQGATGGLLLGTGAAAGDTGSITIQSGNSSSGVSGNVVIDTGLSAAATGTNLELDSFEGSTDGWGAVWGTNNDLASTGTYAKLGSDSLSFTTNAADWDVDSPWPGPSVTPGNLYHFSFWIRDTASGTVRFKALWQGSSIETIAEDVPVSSSGWTQVSGSLSAPIGASSLELAVNGDTASSDTVYIDDVSVDGGSASPVVGIGIANAASVVVGSTAAAGGTLIQGGADGVTITTAAGNGINIGANSNSVITIGDSAGTNPLVLQGDGIMQTITGSTTTPSDIIKTSTNSTSAFQVQDASANSILNVSTSSGAIIVGSTANGGLLVNDGATLNTAKAISNVSGGGSIGSAASTVDIYTTFAVNQTTAGKTLSLPSPTDTTDAGRVAYVLNTGSTAFTMGGMSIGTGNNASFIWNGSAWATAVSGVGSGGGVTSIGSVGTNGQSADGASISGTTLYMQYADSTSFSGAGAPGLVSTGTQGFKGQKTFADLLTAGNGLTVNSAAITGNAGLTVNGAVISANAGLTIGTGAVLLNQGATENTVLALSNFSSNGAMTTAGNINTYTGFTINQTTASISLTLPSPTVDTSNMHTIYVSNIGSAAVTVAGVGIGAGDFASFTWNGSAWSPAAAGLGGAYINNSTTLQSANVNVQATASGTVAAIFRANSSNDADILDLINGAGTPVASVGPTGLTLFKPSAPSTTAFQIQPSGSTTPVLDVDTSNDRVGVNMNNPAYALDVNGAISTNTAVYVNGVSVCTSSCIPSGGSGNYVQNSTSLQTNTNFYVRGVGSTSATGILQGASGQTGDLLDLQTWNGSSATTVDKFNANGDLAIGASGVSSTSAFSVQDSAGDATFTADTTNQQLIAVQNSSSQIKPLLVLKQLSTGDASIQFTDATSTNSFALGLDTTGSDVFKISSTAAAGGGSSIAGSNSQSGSNDNGNSNFESASKVLTTTSGAVTTLHMYVVGGGGNNMQMALYSDDGGSPSAPGTLLASSSSVVLNAGDGWYTFTIPSTNVTASTYYWVVFNTDNSGVNYAWANASTGSLDNDYAVSTFGTWLSAWSSIGSNNHSGNGYAVYMDVAGSSTDEFAGSLFTLGQTGQAKFQNSTDSTGAFSIQNASSASLFSVDTQNSKVIIGAGDAGESSSKLLVLDSDSDATFSGGAASSAPTEVNGAMFYSSTNHDFMCGVAGAWETCNGLLYSNTSVGSASNSCTTACGALGVAPIPANYCQAGRVIHIIAHGVMGTNSSAPTLDLGLYYGTSSTRGSDTAVGGAIPQLSGATTPALTASLSAVPWSLDYTIICFSTTSMNGSGVFTLQNSTTSTTSSLTLQMTPTTTSSLTTTSAANLYLFPQFGTNNSSNTITDSQYVVTGN